MKKRLRIQSKKAVMKDDILGFRRKGVERKWWLVEWE